MSSGVCKNVKKHCSLSIGKTAGQSRSECSQGRTFRESSQMSTLMCVLFTAQMVSLNLFILQIDQTIILLIVQTIIPPSKISV